MALIQAGMPLTKNNDSDLTDILAFYACWYTGAPVLGFKVRHLGSVRHHFLMQHRQQHRQQYRVPVDLLQSMQYAAYGLIFLLSFRGVKYLQRAVNEIIVSEIIKSSAASE